MAHPESLVPPGRFWRRQTRITWHLPLVLVALAIAAAIAWNWNWMTSRPPRVVRLSGTHREIGLAHGRILGGEIRSLYESYVIGGLVGREGRKIDDLIAVGRHYDRFVPEPLREEMRGIAEGAGMSYDSILVMNTFVDAVLGKTPRACSALAVSTSGGLLVGRNLDWTNHKVAHKTGVVFILAPAGERRILSVGWPGMVGVVTGMNEAGLVLTLNMAYAGDLSTETTPTLLRLREILGAESTKDGAVAALTALPRSIAMNVLVASGPERQAVAVELSGTRSAVVGMENGCVVTTNHYQRLDIRGGAGSDRTIRLRRDLEATGSRTTAGDVQTYLSHVCFLGSSEAMVTNQSVVFRPGELVAEVSIGKLPATSGRYFEVPFGR